MDLGKRLDLSKMRALAFGAGLASSAQREELFQMLGPSARSWRS